MEEMERIPLEEVEKIINNSAGKTIVMICECEAEYLGRAKATLGRGERIIIIKRDKSFLIHRPFGSTPAMWMPPPASINARVKSDVLELMVSRASPPEIIKLTISKIISFKALKLVDKSDYSIKPRESDIYEAIKKDPSIVYEGVKILKVTENLEQGQLDVLAEDREGTLIVIEVKRGVAGVDAVEQLQRYVEELREKSFRKVKGVILASSITRDASAELKRRGFEFRRLRMERVINILYRETPSLIEFQNKEE